MNHLRIAQLLCARLCHDLITPVSAIKTGLEIFETSGEKDRLQLLEVIHQSAKTGENRLVFYRAAFGFSNKMGLASPEQILQTLTEFLGPLSIQFKWVSFPVSLNFLPESLSIERWARLVLNVTLALIDAAPYGGELALTISRSKDKLETALTLSGKLVEMRPEAQEALLGTLEESDLTPRVIQPYVTFQLAQEVGFSVSFKEKTTEKVQILLVQSRKDEE